MFKEAPIVRCLKLAFGGGVAGLALVISPAMAQQSSDNGVQQIERTEITGSSIKRIDAETALPVQVVTRAEIIDSGAQTTEDLVRLISSAQSGGQLTQSLAAGASTSGVSTISLRGLGSERTLVLIDGRRATIFGGVPAGGGDTSVDIGSIPLSAIDRVEVLKDGASAVYGSDAVAGVVNIILRKDYVGGEITIGGGDSQHGGASGQHTSALIGFGDLSKDRFNVTLNASYDFQQALTGAQRPFAKNDWNGDGNTTDSSNTFPSNVFTTNAWGLGNPNYPNCAPSIIDPVYAVAFAAYNPYSCAFNTGGYVDLLPQTEKSSLMGSAHFALNADNELYAQFSYNANKVTTRIQPSPISEEFAVPPTNPYNAYLTNLIATSPWGGSTNPYTGAPYNSPGGGGVGQSTLLLPSSSPYFPTAWVTSQIAAGNLPGTALTDPLNVTFRSFITGPRQLTDTSDLTRLVLGAKGTLASWDYDTAFLYTKSEVKEHTDSGFFVISKFAELFDSGVINPFGPSTPAATAAALGTNFYGTAFATTTSVTQLDGHVSRDILALPAGNMSLALGAEVRQEKYTDTPDALLQVGDVSGYGGNILPVSASRNVEGVFGELVIPIAKHLEGDVAVRYDNYQGVGNTTNPKASLRWQPTDQFLFRGSIGTGFRAPQLTDLYAPNVQSVTVAGTADPIRCPVTHSPQDCSNQFTTILGGNSSLQPEKSVQETLGAVWEPNKSVSVGVDIFQIKLRNTIELGGIPYTYFLQNAALAQQYSSYIVRNADGSINHILQTNQNVGKTNINGVDIDLKFRLLNDGVNKVTLALDGTYFNRYDNENPDGSFTGAINQGGSVSSDGVVTHWRTTSGLTFDHGPWSTTLSNFFQSGYNDYNSNIYGTPRNVSPYSIWNLHLTYKGIKNVVIDGGINNLLDSAPPYTNNTSQFQAGYDPTYASAIGRFFYANVSYKFR